MKDIKITKNNSAQYQPTKKDGTKQGYAWEISSGDDKVGVTGFALQSALMNSGALEGDTINIKHTGQSEYTVVIVAKGKDTVSEKAPF